MNIRTIAALSLILTILSARAERTAISLNRDWSFRFSHQVDARATKKVSLPHTWNAQDALSGKIDYKRGIGNYERRLMVEQQWKGKRLWLRFEGANSVADVFVNGKHTGEHRGGYSAFVMEITDKVKYGEENTILVRVNNGERLDVMPLVGDFNFYGGLYRGVSLLISERRLTERHNASPTITVFANVPQVQLVVNGKVIGTQAPDSLHIATWQNVQLRPGSNTIQAIAKGTKKPLCDTINITLLTK